MRGTGERIFEPMTMDKEKVCQAFGRAAASYDIFGRFQREVCERMLCLLPERLPAGFKPVKTARCGLWHRIWVTMPQMLLA